MMTHHICCSERLEFAAFALKRDDPVTRQCVIQQIFRVESEKFAFRTSERRSGLEAGANLSL